MPLGFRSGDTVVLEYPVSGNASEAVWSERYNNPLGLNRNTDKISFHPYFTFKDIFAFCIIIFALLIITLWRPYLLDQENFIPANPLVTPEHIKPEWYYLLAYAILRSIPKDVHQDSQYSAQVQPRFSPCGCGALRACAQFHVDRSVSLWVIANTRQGGGIFRPPPPSVNGELKDKRYCDEMTEISQQQPPLPLDFWKVKTVHWPLWSHISLIYTDRR